MRSSRSRASTCLSTSSDSKGASLLGKRRERRQRKIIGDYCRDIFDAVGLRDWFFYLMDEEATTEDSKMHTGERDECFASIDRTDGAKVAYIRLGPSFLKLSKEQKRHTIVHEALHCHFTDINAVIEGDMEGHLDPVAHHLLSQSICRALEYGIDGVAYEFAKGLPEFPDI